MKATVDMMTNHLALLGWELGYRKTVTGVGLCAWNPEDRVCVITFEKLIGPCHKRRRKWVAKMGVWAKTTPATSYLGYKGALNVLFRYIMEPM